jgi:hypothetical protein
MDIEAMKFLSALSSDDDLSPNALMTNSIIGLVRIGLLDGEYSFGPRDQENAPDSPYEQVLRVRPSVSGAELYGWAQGVAGLAADEFASRAVPFEVDPPILRLVNIRLLRLESERKGADGTAS